MPLTLIDRFHPRLRDEQQVAIDAGLLSKRDELELLDPQNLRPLLTVSIVMLLIGTVFFVTLNIAAYIAQTHIIQGQIGGWGLLLWVSINIVAYIVVMFLHEGIHALSFRCWGGKPYFGAKLPVALYCGAKDQLFRRNHYLVVGLAPLVVITLAGIVVTFVAPVVAAFTLAVTVGNVSGAAGDAWSVARMLRLPATTLVEDTESGYRVWEVTPYP